MVQNIYQVLFYMFIAGILFLTIIARFDPVNLVYVSFPLAFIMTNYFHRKRNPWSHELIIWILVGLVVFLQVTLMTYLVMPRVTRLLQAWLYG